MGVFLEGPHRSEGGPSHLALQKSPLSPTLSSAFLLAGETRSHQAGCPHPEVLAQDLPSELPGGNWSPPAGAGQPGGLGLTGRGLRLLG